MEPSIVGRQVNSGGMNNQKWTEKVVPNATIAVGDILYVTGILGNFLTVAKADADTEAHIGGQLYMAATKGASGEPMKALTKGVITMTTTGSAVGDPVYLSATAGGKSLTVAGLMRRIGTVIKVGASTVGKVLFDGTPADFRNFIIADPGDAGAIPVIYPKAICKLTTGAADTRTIAAPTMEDQELTVYVTVDGGTVVITVATTVNVANNNTITMADVGDYFKLRSVDEAGTFRWVIVENDSAALSTV